MVEEQKALCSNRVFHYFRQICDIPHGSGNEKALSNHILHWAESLGLKAEQDASNNVLVRKAASPGLEAVPGVMLQAHIDMVCEKAVGVKHDFLTDPIRWVIDGDVLSTGGKTTLGADDGIGAALAMAVLEDKGLQHPALEALFTVCEESDFSGAEGFDANAMRSAYLVNLDNTDEQLVVCGSCGGCQVDFFLPASLEAVPAGWNAFRLTVSGLKGGHSGEDIHRGRGNANVLLARLLAAMEKCGEIRLTELKGGSFRLAIPREAEAVVWMNPSMLPTVQERLAAMEADFRAELSATAANVRVVLEETNAKPSGAALGPVLTAIMLIPDGIHQMNEVLTGLVDTSNNLGELYFNENGLHLVLEIRSARNSLREYLFQRMERLATALGGSCQWSNAYPSWNFHPKSALRQIYSGIYKKQTGRELTAITVHAGLEVGYFFAKRPDIDAISIGPDCWDFHSPTESLRISSVKQVYQLLCNLLAAIR